MYILDTNYISILERRGPDSNPLLIRLAQVPGSDVCVTVISYEEQIRGWTAAIAAAKSSSAQVMQYARLLTQLENYCNLTVLPYTHEAAIRNYSALPTGRFLSQFNSRNCGNSIGA